VQPPTDTDDWLAFTAAPLGAGVPTGWAVRSGCGAVVTFSGTTRDHAGDRSGVLVLDYETYEEQAMPALAAVAAEVRRRWPMVGRVALLHRTGEVPVGEVAVVVAVSTPHRAEAFEAASYAIDALKATVPIWKKETWDGGQSWGLDAQHLVSPSEVAGPADR
jgi:molybdopterin synthase catalytic subunit